MAAHLELVQAAAHELQNLERWQRPDLVAVFSRHTAIRSASPSSSAGAGAGSRPNAWRMAAVSTGRSSLRRIPMRVSGQLCSAENCARPPSRTDWQAVINATHATPMKTRAVSTALVLPARVGSVASSPLGPYATVAWKAHESIPWRVGRAGRRGPMPVSKRVPTRGRDGTLQDLTYGSCRDVLSALRTAGESRPLREIAGGMRSPTEIIRARSTTTPPKIQRGTPTSPRSGRNAPPDPRRWAERTSQRRRRCSSVSCSSPPWSRRPPVRSHRRRHCVFDRILEQPAPAGVPEGAQRAS